MRLRQSLTPLLHFVAGSFPREPTGPAKRSPDVATPKPPWRHPEEAYIAHLRSAPPEVLRVSAADKVHNERAILADYRNQHERLRELFKGGRDRTV